MEANLFVELCLKHNEELILVGGAAVNFYGYIRHSADIDRFPNRMKLRLKAKTGIYLIQLNNQTEKVIIH